MNKEEYNQRRDTMLDEHDSIVNKINDIENNRREHAAKRESITRFLSEIEHSAGFLTEFDEELWRSVAESMTVYGESDFAVKFRDGSEVRVGGGDEPNLKPFETFFGILKLFVITALTH